MVDDVEGLFLTGKAKGDVQGWQLSMGDDSPAHEFLIRGHQGHTSSHSQGNQVAIVNVVGPEGFVAVGS